MIRILFILILSVMTQLTSSAQTETATFGGGCFWCTEAIFKSLKGVETVESGYSGGKLKNPTYKEVCTGETGHAEVIQITYDPKVISFRELLEVFWETHDPTTLNQQGADRGTQYRSVVFYHTPQQKELAEKYKAELNKGNVFGKPVVTEITAFDKFYKAENYHQDYFTNNSTQGYCQFVIVPKLQKFRKVFKDKLK
ncbi:MAG: peptide-methionine (S)-S-oxide reductase MsrA [Prolixibacteraceae bacterium]|nr:peptide-methionine (S)-S-oxide reductase MsrA [Prolixibacteraceae bacterium]